ncbi:MAG: zf-HC2 domain-containing protein [Bryobacteraceae bacterium]|nr:zf-HC2 domain-containing protein [Bryobacteraceae bacterium]
MSCPEADIKGYVLGELDESGRRRAEEHVAGCRSCAEEFDRLQATQAALRSVRDEEVPQRIAFVSDKIFEPRWWRALWSSGARWAFASASVLAAAIVAHAIVTRPVPVAPAQPDVAAIQAIVEREVSRRVGDAVALAVAQARAQDEEKTAARLAAAEKQFEAGRQEDRLYFAQNLEVLSKRMNVMHLASADRGPR